MSVTMSCGSASQMGLLVAHAMEIAGANRHRGFLVTRLGQAGAPAFFCLFGKLTNGSSDELLGFDRSVGLIMEGVLFFPFFPDGRR